MTKVHSRCETRRRSKNQPAALLQHGGLEVGYKAQWVALDSNHVIRNISTGSQLPRQIIQIPLTALVPIHRGARAIATLFEQNTNCGELRYHASNTSSTTTSRTATTNIALGGFTSTNILRGKAKTTTEVEVTQTKQHKEEMDSPVRRNT